MQLGANYGSFYNSFDQENQSPAAGHHPLHNCIQFMPLQQQNSSYHHRHHHQRHHHQEENYLSFSVFKTTTIKMMMRMIMQEMIKCCCMDSRPRKVRKNTSFCFIAMSFCYKICANPRCATIGYAFYFSMQTIECTNVLECVHFFQQTLMENVQMCLQLCTGQPRFLYSVFHVL